VGKYLDLADEAIRRLEAQRPAEAGGACIFGRGGGSCPACGHAHGHLELHPPCDACGVTDQVVMLVTAAGARYCRACRRTGGPQWGRST
jgi:hypothetical protein